MQLTKTDTTEGNHLLEKINEQGDAIKLKYFSALLVLLAGNSPATGEFPSQRSVTPGFDVFFDLRLKNGRANNGDAGDLRRHRAHNVIIMKTIQLILFETLWFRPDYPDRPWDILCKIIVNISETITFLTLR